MNDKAAEIPTTAQADASRQVASQIEDIEPADGAAILEAMPTGDAADVTEYLDPHTAAGILARMDSHRAAEIMQDMQSVEACVVLEHMRPDDRVDILGHLGGGLQEQILGDMKPADAADVRQLQQYPSDTAGGIMTTAVTALYEHITVDNAVTLLRRLNEELEQMFYVYVIDRRQQLVGVLSMRDLILAKPTTPLNAIMIRNVRSVPVTMDQEHVAQLMRKHGYLALPVVDERQRLVGLITLDDVIDVLEQETTEDVQKMFGAGAEERLTSPWLFSFKKRVWWLEVNLGTAFLAAAVVGAFEGLIQKLAILAAYMPVVAGMGGNASAQAMSVSIRGLAVGKVDRAAMRHVLYRELLVGLATGLVVGITTFIIALIFHSDMGLFRSSVLGGVICSALVINQSFACTSGAAIPFVMKWLGFDPAQSATIFATTITDVVGFFSLLGLAYLCLPWLT